MAGGKGVLPGDEMRVDTGTRAGMYLACGGDFLTPEVFQNDAYVCRDRYWVEFLPVEDRFGSDAPVEDAV
jgi:hypothetical protein